MTIRNTLLGNVTTAVTGSSIGVSTELPFTASGQQLHIKNKKTFYLGEANQDVTTLFATIDRNDVFQTETSLTGFIAVDAKNIPTDMETVVNSVLLSRQSIDNQSVNECSVTIDIQDDILIYTFQYRFVTVN